MKLLIAILLTAGLLTGLALGLPAHRASGPEVGTVAADWRSLATTVSFLGPGCTLGAAAGLVLFRRPARRGGSRRGFYTGMQWILAALTAWAAIPACSALLFYQQLYAPLDVGGMTEPLPRAWFAALRTAWLGGGAILGVIVFVWLVVKVPEHHRKRLSAGHECETCGYDLRGNVSGRCPECGAAIDLGRRAQLQAPPPQPAGSAVRRRFPTMLMIAIPIMALSVALAAYLYRWSLSAHTAAGWTRLDAGSMSDAMRQDVILLAAATPLFVGASAIWWLGIRGARPAWASGALIYGLPAVLLLAVGLPGLVGLAHWRSIYSPLDAGGTLTPLSEGVHWFVRRHNWLYLFGSMAVWLAHCVQGLPRERATYG